jgi:hypothetical protein
MPQSLYRDMHQLLTQDDPNTCRKYHYNFERKAPRLYDADQRDSILDIIEYIKTECGPASNLEIARILLLADMGGFSDSLIGSSTISQMLWFRSEQEYLLDWQRRSLLYGYPRNLDNTYDNFHSFLTGIAEQAASDPEISPMGQTIGLYYSGQFDSAFTRVQSNELEGTALRENYDDFVQRVKNEFSRRGHIGFQVGDWIPKGNINRLGKHPDIGLQLGGEGNLFRGDAVISYKFLSAKEKYQVDSLGQLVPTDEFNCWLFGAEGGVKFIDRGRISTDLFIGVGWEVLLSVVEAGDPNTQKTHSSPFFSFGLRQRIFLDKRSGWYVGGAVRYSIVDYSNSGGTDLSGNALTVSIVTGWSIHETLKQFLTKLNYHGDWR